MPKNICNLDFSILCAEFAPTLAINIVIGIKIKKAGKFINPMLSGKLAFNIKPEYQNPIAPHKAIIKPIVAALPMAFLIGYPKYLRIGTFITAPPIPMGAEMKPETNPNKILNCILKFLFLLDCWLEVINK
tara:strand:+ start:479 stop:871 length:393 start_codon:yes stop_codon:yes gene_type:complete